MPHYRDLFRELRLDPREIRTAADLAQLPILDKSTVRADPSRFVSETGRGRRAELLETSGTSGRRLPILHDRQSLLANIAHGERDRRVVTSTLGRTGGYRVLTITYESSTIHHVLSLYRQWTHIPIRPDRSFHSVEEPLPQIVGAINSLRPEVVVGYGSYLETLFRALTARKIQIHPPQVVIYGAEAMSSEGKEFIQREYGLPVYSRYGSVEALKIGFTCEADSGFHLNDDLYPLRLVDEQGRSVPRGESGQVVISNLINRGTVLLNYRLGDIGVLAKRSCLCGRTLPLLGELRGRVEEVLFLPDGRFVHPRAIWGVFKKHPEILRYQLVQLEAGRFDLKLMTVNRGVYDSAVGGVLADLGNLLGEVAIEPYFTEDLATREPRKFQPVIPLGDQPTEGQRH